MTDTPRVHAAVRPAPRPLDARAPNRPLTLTEVQRAIGNRAMGRLVTARPLARKEVGSDSEVRGPQDWTWLDRVYGLQRWKDACLYNLTRVDSSQYERIAERRDFYKWFYEYTAARGWETRWALAAALVANGAYQIAYMDVEHRWANETLDMADVELQATMRRGNQVIFDNVLPKLKKLLDGGPLRGRAALEWDMKVLAEEQTLIQPLYDQMAPETFEQLDYIARKRRFAGLGAEWSGEENVAKGPYNTGGIVPGFREKSLRSIYDRWLYGMKLGGMFSSIRIRTEGDPNGRSWFNPRQDFKPDVAADYSSGRELAKVDTQAGLHHLDAWLNPNRVSRTGPGSDMKAIIGKLTEADKRRVLSDRSVDGWAYSEQFAQFISITEGDVRQALPSGSDAAAAVSVFLDRFRRERRNVELQLNALSGVGGPM